MSGVLLCAVFCCGAVRQCRTNVEKRERFFPEFSLPASKGVVFSRRAFFLGVLGKAVGPDYRVLGKVRVADVASLKRGPSASVRHGALNRIALGHFDFVVCRASDLVVVCAVELNEK